MAKSGGPGKLPITLENIQPILSVSDMAASRVFYCDILGFKEAEWGTDDFTSVNRDGAGIYLCRGGQGKPGTWVWIGFDGNIYQLFDHLQANGVSIHMEPKNFSWALELNIEDPDGHILRFGTDPDPALPYLNLAEK